MSFFIHILGGLICIKCMNDVCVNFYFDSQLYPHFTGYLQLLYKLKFIYFYWIKKGFV